MTINASAKVRTDRAAAERRIAALEVRRAKQLLASDDISLVDQIDAAIETERRAIRILDEREAALARADRKQARKDREADRAAALKVIAPILAQRTVWATELEASLKNVVSLYGQILDDKQIRAVWPFGFPDRFSFRPSDLGMEILRALRDCPGGYEILPGPVRATLAHGGPGYTQEPAAGPRPPDDLPGKVAANATFIMGVLSKMQINPPESADDDDKVKLEAVA